MCASVGDIGEVHLATISMTQPQKLHARLTLWNNHQKPHGFFPRLENIWIVVVRMVKCGCIYLLLLCSLGLASLSYVAGCVYMYVNVKHTEPHQGLRVMMWMAWWWYVFRIMCREIAYLIVRVIYRVGSSGDIFCMQCASSYSFVCCKAISRGFRFRRRLRSF